MISRGITERRDLFSAGGTHKAAVVFLKFLTFHNIQLFFRIQFFYLIIIMIQIVFGRNRPQNGDQMNKYIKIPTVLILAVLAFMTIFPFSANAEAVPFGMPDGNVTDEVTGKTDVTDNESGTGTDTGSAADSTASSSTTDSGTAALDGTTDAVTTKKPDTSAVTTAPATTTPQDTEDMENGTSAMGIVIALAIAAAVVVLIFLLMPKKKR